MTSKVYGRGLNIGLIICLSALSAGCHKDSITPVVININLGYEGSINGGWTFIAFKDQNQISASDLQSNTQTDIYNKGIQLAFSESGVPCNVLGYSGNGSGNLPTWSSLEFLFNISTTKDKEIFVTGKNGWVSGIGGGSNLNNNCSIAVWYTFPIKLTSHFTTNNDTLEINPLDTVKINYRSLYTSKTFSSKLAVTQ
jgi:hypothetical protein